MILADKIIQLRKKNGWSQEDLAQQMGVSRQSISKWEGAQSVPDLNKIIKMSALFGVSTDYLLKDEMHQEEYVETEAVDIAPLRKVSMDEANTFLYVNQKYANSISIGICLCMAAWIPFLLLSTAASSRILLITELYADIFGLILSFLILAVGVAYLMFASQQMENYEYLKKDAIDTEYGISGMVESKKNEFKDTYNKRNIGGVVLCIVSLIPLFLSGAFSEKDFYLALGFCGLLLLVSAAVYQFVYIHTIMDGYNKLLEVKQFDRQHKFEKKNEKTNSIVKIYWSLIIVIYIVVSFLTWAWGITWLIWIVAWPIESLIQFIFKK